MLKSLIIGSIPVRLRAHIRRYVVARRKRRAASTPPLSEADFRKVLVERLGVKSGGIVFVHAAFDKLNANFDALRAFAILRDVVGPSGTLLFPSTHLNRRPELSIASGEIFDVKKSPTTMGILAEIARRQRLALRSLHPTSSVCAIGPLAEPFIFEHGTSPYPFDEASPYFKLVAHEGTIIGLGVSTENLSFVHCVEDVRKDQFPIETLMPEPMPGLLRDQAGIVRKVMTLVPHPRIRWRNVRQFMRKHVASNECEDLSIAGTQFFRADAAALFAAMSRLSADGITIYSRWIERRRPTAAFIGARSSAPANLRVPNGQRTERP